MTQSKWFLDLDAYGRDLERLAALEGFGGHYMQLARGALWPCQVAAHHDAFAKRFGFNMYASSDDALLLDSIGSVSQIEAFRRRPHPMCRHCDNGALTIAPWKQSGYEAGEWLA